MRKAIKNNELRLVYQPRMELKGNQISSYEALIRWDHPTKGLIRPNEFIPLAEETGLIVPMGEWVLNEACKQNKKWQKSGFKPMAVAVNFSARQFLQHDLLETVFNVLRETKLDPSFLEIEITENSIMQDTESNIEMLKNLKQKGIKISLDDFGTGYSSLSYLKRFPIDILKIDRSFVKEIETNKEDAAIVKSIIDLAHSLSFNVIAEGVENKKQLDLLKGFNCDQVQGYYISKPSSLYVYEQKFLVK